MAGCLGETGEGRGEERLRGRKTGTVLREWLDSGPGERHVTGVIALVPRQSHNKLSIRRDKSPGHTPAVRSGGEKSWKNVIVDGAGGGGKGRRKRKEGRLTKSREGRRREAFCQREIGRFRGLAVVKRFIQPQRAGAAKQISLFTTGSTFER